MEIFKTSESIQTAAAHHPDAARLRRWRLSGAAGRRAHGRRPQPSLRACLLHRES